MNILIDIILYRDVQIMCYMSKLGMSKLGQLGHLLLKKIAFAL